MGRGATGAEGFQNTQGGRKNDNEKTLSNKIPNNDSVTSHLTDTPENKNLLETVANDGDKWFNVDGSIKWPPNDGFEGTPIRNTLQPGMRIDRYGYEGGSFASPFGISYEARSLAPGTETKPYYVYEVIKPFEVFEGNSVPWFDQPGGGIQYKLFNTIEELINDGFIRRVTP